ncbi:MAG: Rpn family recombination-promoting nuclease/putative transposase [Deltaproteobacteria bacterium]|nr:Rpn family recombination-promoting nuclease/putative transposase [Deltaproteobacteria bacterium]
MLPIPDGPLGIDPRVDIVFHAIFADPANEAARIDLLSSVLDLELTEARVESPFQIGSYEDDHGVVVDVLAKDAQGRTYHIEMQRRAEPGLAQRMLYAWARLYAGQLERGAAYTDLRPVISLWICEQDAFPDSPAPQLRFEPRDLAEGRALHSDMRIEVLQLRRWARERAALLGRPAGRWFWFFNEAATAAAAPDEVLSPGVEEAMTVLRHFRSDDQLGALYRYRETYDHVQATWQKALEAQRREVEAQRARLEAQQVEIEAQQAEIDAQRAAAQAKQAELDAQRAAAEAQRVEIEAQRAAAEAQRVEIEAQRAAAQAKQAELQAQRAAAEAQRVEIEAQRVEIEAQRAAAEAKQAELQAQAAEDRARIAALAAEIAALRGGDTR